jgi:drug/metabolite transporter (DMT)-like permease
MHFFLLAILLNAAIGFVFKEMVRKKIPVFEVILINYLTCSTFGLVFYSNELVTVFYEKPQWLYYPAGLGFFFIGGFVATAKSVHILGMGPTAILQRISLILTVLFAWYIWGESLALKQIAGLCMAVVAIFLVNNQTKTIQTPYKKGWMIAIPIFTFLASGIIDSSFYHVKARYPGEIHDGVFTTLIFLTAFCIGVIVQLVQSKTLDPVFTRSNARWGILLGIPNFFSILTLIKAMDSGLQAAVLFPVYNMSIILIAAAGGILFYKEKVYFWNMAGLVLSLLSILLISL